jgi:prefoldin beta subunit
MENQEKLQELQILEQNLQRLMMQKQSYQMELAETGSALTEINDSKEDAYKIIGQLMIRTSREKVLEELEEKKKIFETKITTLDKQEEEFVKSADVIRNEIFKKKE